MGPTPKRPQSALGSKFTWKANFNPLPYGQKGPNSKKTQRSVVWAPKNYIMDFLVKGDRPLARLGIGSNGTPRKVLLLLFPTVSTSFTSFTSLPNYPILFSASQRKIPGNRSNHTFIKSARSLYGIGFASIDVFLKSFPRVFQKMSISCTPLNSLPEWHHFLTPPRNFIGWLH